MEVTYAISKREALENIPPEAWMQSRTPQGPISLWSLHPRWLAACFGSEFQRAHRDTDPLHDLAGCFGFVRQDGTYAFLLFSKRAPLQTYEVEWAPGTSRACPCMNGQPLQNAEVIPLEGNPQVLLLRNAELGEQIQFHIETLESGLAPARAAREIAALEPWKRVLWWYLAVRQADPDTYMKKLHQAFRQFLESVPLNGMTLEHLQYFQAQRLLPETLPEVRQENMTQIMADIRAQQACFNSPHARLVPRVFMAVDAARLSVVDAQGLVMIGALKELQGFVQRELLKLGQTHPEIKRLWNTPNGRAQIMQHPTVIALMQHPEAQYEMQESTEKAMRQQGAMTGTMGDVDSLLANKRAMEMYYGTGGNRQRIPPPPWKIYQAFDPNEPQQSQQGSFDILGSLGLRF